MKTISGGGTLKRVFTAAAFTLALLLPLSVYALSVGEAKRAGMVTEASNGYIAAVPSKRTPAVDKLVSQTNAARKAKYRDIAKKLNVKIGVVEKDFGKKLGGR